MKKAAGYLLGKHDFKGFGWYRIALGALVLAVLVVPKLFA